RKPYIVLGTIYVRRGTLTDVATPADVDEIIRDRLRSDDRWERRIAPGLKVEDLDLAAVREVAARISRGRRAEFRDPINASSVLEDLGVVADDQISNAAVVLFGARPSSVYPQILVRLTVYESDKTGARFLRDRD